MKQTNKKNKILIGMIVFLCVVIVVGIIYFTNQKKSESDGTFKPDLDPNASEVQEDSEDKPTGIRIPGYPSITIDADTTEVSMDLMNPEGNPCYFTFEIILKDTEEVLYTSKMVEPGKAITKVTLSHSLSSGDYDAIIRITTNSLEDGSTMNGANVETVLKVE